MHEFSLINDLMRKIDTIAREQNAKRVTAVKVRLGALAHISADHFREHFVESAKGTIADGAKLQVESLTDENDPQAQDIVLESLEVEQ
jgi:hydrogenase nickel incorporation protein HypA/HybF